MNRPFFIKIFTTLLICWSLMGCQSAYYATMERFGVEKRDILVDRVDEARDAQHDASDQFESALEQFSALTQFEGGDLQTQYEKLKKTFEESEERAENVKSRIKDVQHVGDALFKEWRSEIKQYSDPKFRANSERQLKRTEARYKQLIASMKRSEKRIDPVLNAFRDRVLYLKHNLSARALTSLKGDVVSVRNDVSALFNDMQKSIQQADDFIIEFKH